MKQFLLLLPALGLLALLLHQPRVTARSAAPEVTLWRVPNNGIQPQAATDERGATHLIYLSGEASASDIYYVRREPGAADFSRPLRVNSAPGSAIAVGTVRGAHLAIGKRGRAHVAWMGASGAEPKAPGNAAPMLYARMDDARAAFEPQRNLIQFATGLDGGGSIAADPAGNVYVAWHGTGDSDSEAKRRVWLARSGDDGRTFAREQAAWAEPTGACGCCGMRALADATGRVFMLYRSATDLVNRDTYLLASADRGQTFQGARLHQWKINACPMSTASLLASGPSVLATWETAGQVWWAEVNATTLRFAAPIAAPGATGRRKHPVLARNARGETLLAWTEGTGWKKGGRVAWQVFDQRGKPTAEQGEADGVPVWSLAAVVANPDNSFTIFY